MKNMVVISDWLGKGFKTALFLGLFFLTSTLHGDVLITTFLVTEPEVGGVPFLSSSEGRWYVAYIPTYTTNESEIKLKQFCLVSVCGEELTVVKNELTKAVFGASYNYILYREVYSYNISHIVLYDISMGTNFDIVPIRLGLGDAGIHGEQIVWVQQTCTTVDNCRYGILKTTPTDVAAGVLPQVIRDPVPDGINAIEIGSRFIVWEEECIDAESCNFSDSNILAYDLVTGITRCVACAGEVDQIDPDTSGPWVIWQEKYAGHVRLVARNLDTQETRNIKVWPINEFPSFVFARIDHVGGDLITYEDIPEGLDKKKIFAYRLSTNETFQVTFGPDREALPNVMEPFVAYIGDARTLTQGHLYIAHLEFLPDNPDGDSDGIPDDVDQCPSEDSTGLDANGDGCIDTLDNLTEVVEQLLNEEVIDATMATSLLQKVTNAISINDKENICAAVDVLEAFKSQIDAQRGKKISEDAADLLIEFTDNVISDLLSSGVSC